MVVFQPRTYATSPAVSSGRLFATPLQSSCKVLESQARPRSHKLWEKRDTRQIFAVAVFVERHALDVLHDDVWNVVVGHARIVGFRDVGMIKQCQGLGFRGEAGEVGRVGLVRTMIATLRSPSFAEAALAEALAKRVRAEGHPVALLMALVVAMSVLDLT